VCQQLSGKPFPQTYEELIALPGIGDYTANAVLAFAYNKEVPVLDTNIRRVLIHELILKETTSEEELKKIAQKCIPKGKSCMWHNALMDYGAMEKTARKTGIASLSKQGKFEGSDREVRGWIIRQLTQKKKLTTHIIEKAFPNKDIKKIIEKMVNNQLIRKEKKLWVL